MTATPTSQNASVVETPSKPTGPTQPPQAGYADKPTPEIPLQKQPVPEEHKPDGQHGPDGARSEAPPATKEPLTQNPTGAYRQFTK